MRGSCVTSKETEILELNLANFLVLLSLFAPVYVFRAQIENFARRSGKSFYFFGICFALAAIAILFVLEFVPDGTWQLILESLFLFLAIMSGIIFKQTLWESFGTKSGNKDN